jgi:type II secretion system protein N
MNRLTALLERLRGLKLLPLAGWHRTAAWAGLGVFLFAFFLAVTFPYDAVRARLAAQAENAGYFLHIDSLGPAFLGITAHGARLTPQGGDAGALATAVRVDRLTLRPSLLPWGLGFSAELFGGQASGSVGTGSAPSIRLKARGLSLRKSALQAMTGIDADGTLDADLSLDVPAGGARGAGPDLGSASGTVRLGGKGLAIQGGTVNVPMMGQTMAQGIPAVALGALELELPIEKGLGTLKTFHVDGADLEVRATGTVKLARALAYAEPDIVFRIRPLPDFLRRLGPLGVLFSQLPVDPTDSAFRDAKLTGYLGKPAFRPGR